MSSALESWSFPPAYDDDYFPDAASRYWFPRRETMPSGERERFILERLKTVCAYAYEKSPFYKRKWEEAGFHPSHLKSLEDFESKVPVVHKKDLRAAQERTPPFGDYLCVPEDDVFHIHGTSGTTGRPTAFAIGRNDWRAIANAHARIMWGMGLRPGDTICVAAIFSLYMGSWGALIGAERLRAKCFPFGAGVPGMSARCAQWLNIIKPTAFYGTPTYALHLAQVAQDEGLNPLDFRLKLLFFSGEPGASIPGVRDRIEEVYGARVIDCGSMAEMTPWMNVAGSRETSGLLCWQDVVYTEVCDPATMRRVPYGQRGTPVYTHLERTSQPMSRRRAAAPIRAYRKGFLGVSTICSRSAAKMSIRARSTPHSTKYRTMAESTASSSAAKRRWTSCCYASRQTRRPSPRGRTRLRNFARRWNANC
jgi:phenylacetate-CoA ligase